MYAASATSYLAANVSSRIYGLKVISSPGISTWASDDFPFKIV